MPGILVFSASLNCWRLYRVTADYRRPDSESQGGKNGKNESRDILRILLAQVHRRTVWLRQAIRSRPGGTSRERGKGAGVDSLQAVDGEHASHWHPLQPTFFTVLFLNRIQR